LAGALSRPYGDLKLLYIGPLSRFERPDTMSFAETIYDYIFILSGPEPQRSIFENSIIAKFEGTFKKILIVRGKPQNSKVIVTPSNIISFNHLNDNKILSAINCSKRIVCRSGYSSIMDLAIIGRRAILIATPAQPEQEYIANHLVKTFGFVSCKQSQFIEEDLDLLKYEELWDYPIEKNFIEKVIHL
jgi:hypothetical protein